MKEERKRDVAQATKSSHISIFMRGEQGPSHSLNWPLRNSTFFPTETGFSL